MYILNKFCKFIIFALHKFYYVTSNVHRLILRGDRVSYTLYVLDGFHQNTTKIPPCESNRWGKFGGNSSFPPKLVEKSLFHQIKW